MIIIFTFSSNRKSSQIFTPSVAALKSYFEEKFHIFSSQEQLSPDSSVETGCIPERCIQLPVSATFIVVDEASITEDGFLILAFIGQWVSLLSRFLLALGLQNGQ